MLSAISHADLGPVSTHCHGCPGWPGFGAFVPALCTVPVSINSGSLLLPCANGHFGQQLTLSLEVVQGGAKRSKSTSRIPPARYEPFEGHNLAEFLRRGFPDVLRTLIKELSAANGSDYIVKGSAGQGEWVFCPWVAVFVPIVTDSAERGFYPVYLFRKDFTGLYLTLNQV